MAKYYDDSEYHIPSNDQDYKIPVEEGFPKEEPPLREESGAFDEYNEDVPAREAAAMAQEDNKEHGYRGAANRHEWLKRMFMRPVAAMLIGVGVLTAGIGIDHLGQDYLMHEHLDGFPTLPNPDPDWEGKFDWSRQSAREYAAEYALEYARENGQEYYQEVYDQIYNEIYKGPELYLRYSMETENGSEYGYLVKGPTWEEQDPDTPLTEGPEDGSLRYDKDTNTLTLNNFKGSLIEANMMGNAFKIRVLGENYVDFIQIWGAGHSGSVTFTGNGKLTVGRKADPEGDSYEGGIVLMGESGVTHEIASACLMVDREVTLDVYGAPAISIETTAMEKAIYYLSPIKLTGGTPLSHSSREDYPDEPDRPDHQEPVWYSVTVADADGNPSNHVTFAPGR